MKNVAWKLVPDLCKEDSVEVSMLIWTNFDSFAITYISDINSLLQKFHFPIEVMLDSLQTQKDLELVFRPVFVAFFDEIFSFVT